jgi:protein PsiE
MMPSENRAVEPSEPIGDEKVNAPLGNPKFGPKVRNTATTGFRLIESGLLISIALLTLGAALIEIMGIWRAQTITLADILLMFLYTEVIGMVAVFYTRLGSPFIYPIFIAITALSRLIVLQGKEMAPENIVFEASAILLLALATIVIVKVGKA